MDTYSITTSAQSMKDFVNACTPGDLLLPPIKFCAWWCIVGLSEDKQESVNIADSSHQVSIYQFNIDPSD